MIDTDSWKKEIYSAAKFPVLFTLAWIFFSLVQFLAGSPKGFAAAGAVGVGVHLASFTYLKSKIQGQFSSLIWLNFGQTSGVLRGWFAGMDSETTQWGNLPEFPSFGEDLAEYWDDLESLANRILFCEVILLVIATLQWAYGDALFCTVKGNGVAQC